MVVFSKDWPYGSNRGAITELDDMSQAVMDIIRVISKDFQAHGNCLWMYAGEQNIEQLVFEAEGTTKLQINWSGYVHVIVLCVAF